MQTRHTLLQRMLDSSDDNSWSEFDEIYRPYIFKIIYRMNFTKEEAEDICQHIMLTLVQKLSDFKHNFRKGAFRTWLSRMIKNHSINQINKHQRQASYLNEGNKELLSPFLDKPINEIEKIVEEEWVAHVTELAWEKVKLEFEPKIIKTFALSAKNIPGEEVASELEISINTVYVYKNRVKKRLEEVIRILKVEYV